MTSIVYAVKGRGRQILYLGFMTYFVAMFFYFGKGNGHKGGFSIERYTNALW